jgi:hypothetical protein
MKRVMYYGGPYEHLSQTRFQAETCARKRHLAPTRVTGHGVARLFFYHSRDGAGEAAVRRSAG